MMNISINHDMDPNDLKIQNSELYQRAQVKLNDGSNGHFLAISLSTTNRLVGELPTDELYSVKQRLEVT